ncbi:hypothetical protein TNCV_1104961 [Trichonephila clavipes]|nr:hypothetical protein TNCV_1104961 [Trichonephila clavipes]
MLLYYEYLYCAVLHSRDLDYEHEGGRNLGTLFERKVLKSVFGGIQEKGICRRRINVETELYRTSKESGNTRRGRYRLQWIVAVEEDCLVLKTKNRKSLAAYRDGWKRLTQKAFACRVVDDVDDILK